MNVLLFYRSCTDNGHGEFRYSVVNQLVEPTVNSSMMLPVRGCNTTVKSYMEMAVDTNKEQFSKYFFSRLSVGSSFVNVKPKLHWFCKHFKTAADTTAKLQIPNVKKRGDIEAMVVCQLSTLMFYLLYSFSVKYHPTVGFEVYAINGISAQEADMHWELVEMSKSIKNVCFGKNLAFLSANGDGDCDSD